MHADRPISQIASQLKLSEQELDKRIETAREKLFSVREKRIHPNKDDKVLADWDGLMIAALAKGAQALNEPRYTEAAKRAADFILNYMRNKDGQLLHRYRDGESAIQANVDDYAFLVWGLIELYEATFDTHYLKTALDLNNSLIERFWDDKGGGFYFTPQNGEGLLARQKEIYDGAIPSGNSVEMLNLLRMGRITANSDLEKKAAQIERAFSSQVKKVPAAYTQLMSALDFGVGPSYELVIVGKSHAEDTEAMLKVLRRQFIPNKVLLFRPAEEKAPDITRIAGFTKSQLSLNGRATAYVCKNYVCDLPTTDISKMLELLHTKEKNKSS